MYAYQGVDQALISDINNLKTTEYVVEYYQSVSATSGQVGIPANATVQIPSPSLGNRNAIVSQESGGQPTGIVPTDASGNTITVSSFDGSGNYILSGTPSSYPVAIVFTFTIQGQYLSTLNDSYILEPPAPTSVMIGATSLLNGQAGIVPTPIAGKQLSFLRGDGTWASPSAGITALVGDVTASGTGSVTATVAGIQGKSLPSLTAGLLRYSGSAWVYDTNTYLTGITSTLVNNAFGSTAINLVYASPSSGGAGTPSFRALVAADIPSLPYVSSTLTNANLLVGNASNVATAVALSGDGSISNTGALTVLKIGGQSVSLGGSFTVSGAFTTTLTVTANTSVTLPTSGTLMANPMTTLGDIIYGGASGSPTRKAAGSQGTILQMGASSIPAWNSNILDTNGNILIGLTTVASATNYLSVSNNTSTTAPSISVNPAQTGTNVSGLGMSFNLSVGTGIGVSGLYSWNAPVTTTSGTGAQSLSPLMQLQQLNTASNWGATLILNDSTHTGAPSSTLYNLSSNLGNLVINANGGNIAFRVGGTTTYAQISSSAFTLTDGMAVVFGTSNGSIIGNSTTQKLSFWNKTPVVQPSGAAEAALVTTSSTNVTPYGYTTQAQADSIITFCNEVQRVLTLIGLWKGSA